ncbi:sensor histidine kinase [Motiliproteus sediminis]|uniref:sensor histidine kinase n=1 Tax=Motiliproteus sediminis TaxID=1468178 RepID=UPI001AEFF856|nr:HAMP domain-containing sensor histidine kinase [Motiliproteus sediminis]
MRSLKGKSALFLVVLFTYCLGLAAYVLYQKGLLVRQLEELTRIQERETVLVEADLAAFSAITDLFVMTDVGGREDVLNRVHLHFTQLQQRYARLLVLYPDRAPPFKEMLRKLAETLVQPTPEAMALLRRELADNKRRLDELMNQNREMRQQATAAYLARSDQVALVSLLLGVVGLALLGFVVALFFGRLTRDLLGLHRRVGQIVTGYRGAPLERHREDELGELISGVNAMANDLRQREQELEIERQKQFHLDKMGTIGHVAAGVVHEVGNPVAAIIGLADEARGLLQENTPEAVESGRSNLTMISDYAERLRQITEDLAALNRPQQEEFCLLDLNELIDGVEKVLRYDERWYGLRLQFDLDRSMPALNGVSDQLSQLVMNLVVNACESLEVARPANPLVCVTTAAIPGGVRLVVEDNGGGMSEEVRERAFEAFYTTKESKGSGLGLLLCGSIVSAHHGRLAIFSQPGEGCRVEVELPLEAPVADVDEDESL